MNFLDGIICKYILVSNVFLMKCTNSLYTKIAKYSTDIFTSLHMFDNYFAQMHDALRLFLAASSLLELQLNNAVVGQVVEGERVRVLHEQTL
jgi:hypothetical protein